MIYYYDKDVNRHITMINTQLFKTLRFSDFKFYCYYSAILAGKETMPLQPEYLRFIKIPYLYIMKQIASSP